MVREKVIVQPVMESDFVGEEEWPSGELIFQTLQEHCVPLAKNQLSARYWRIAARWALLQKYGYLGKVDLSAAVMYRKDKDGRFNIDFCNTDEKVIEECWNTMKSSEKHSDDVVELVQTQKSNKRKLKWSFMDCEAGCQFNLHAHPNIELVYCCKGELFEVRMDGAPVDRNYQKVEGTSDKLAGPDMIYCSRPWHFATLSEGQWLVNEVGSVHKSFTSTSGNGCVLLVLWGGSHADIPMGQEPKLVNVDEAVNRMDERIGRCACSDWNSISDTFLPASEKGP